MGKQVNHVAFTVPHYQHTPYDLPLALVRLRADSNHGRVEGSERKARGCATAASANLARAAEAERRAAAAERERAAAERRAVDAERRLAEAERRAGGSEKGDGREGKRQRGAAPEQYVLIAVVYG